MSAIFGLVRRNGQAVDSLDLKRMAARLAFRGPDGGDTWCEDSVGLGQLMLCTTPESLHERLPWQDPESRLVITADARIDNRAELAKTLGLDRSLAATWPDTRFILESYKRWGVSCVHHLLGDFSFVIWDGQQRRLFCARDPVGSRPFYFHQSSERFVFASSAQAVVAADGVPDVLNEERIADYLVFELEGIDDRCTFFRDVFRLPPAHCGVYANGRFSAWKYWAPNTEVELRLGSDEEYTEALEDVLTSAVGARLRSHRPPAAMVSGGVDSSTIAALARRLLEGSGTRLRTFSGVSEVEADCRESRNIRSVLGTGGFESRVFRPSDVESMAAGLGQVAARIEDPFDSHCILLAMMYLAARQDGSVVMLDGLDGDGVASLTSGYPAYLVRDGEWLSAHREILGQRKNYFRAQYSPWRDYWDAIRPALAPAAFWRRRWEIGFRRMAERALEHSFIAPELARRVDLESRFRSYHQGRGTLLAPSLRHAQARRVQVPYLTVAVERYARLAAYAGMEQRQPLLDRRVIEYFVSLPWQQKASHGWSKVSLRRVAARYLPQEVAWRRGWDAISYKFLDAAMTLDREEKYRFMTGQAGRWGNFIDVAHLDQAMIAHHQLGHDGQKEALVFYLLQWLARPERAGSAVATELTGSRTC